MKKKILEKRGTKPAYPAPSFTEKMEIDRGDRRAEKENQDDSPLH